MLGFWHGLHELLLGDKTMFSSFFNEFSDRRRKLTQFFFCRLPDKGCVFLAIIGGEIFEGVWSVRSFARELWALLLRFSLRRAPRDFIFFEMSSLFML
jgi:hypothetical protein